MVQLLDPTKHLDFEKETPTDLVSEQVTAPPMDAPWVDLLLLEPV